MYISFPKGFKKEKVNTEQIGIILQIRNHTENVAIHFK